MLLLIFLGNGALEGRTDKGAAAKYNDGLATMLFKMTRLSASSYQTLAITIILGHQRCNAQCCKQIVEKPTDMYGSAAGVELDLPIIEASIQDKRRPMT